MTEPAPDDDIDFTQNGQPGTGICVGIGPVIDVLVANRVVRIPRDAITGIRSFRVALTDPVIRPHPP